MDAAWPTTVTTSRWPRALARSTQKPFSTLWYVTLDETGKNFLRLILGRVFHTFNSAMRAKSCSVGQRHS